jgi:uncharacterized protein with HEPN domain
MTAVSPEASVLLWDARQAAEKIVRFTSGRSFDDYLADEMMSAAVERQFEIIGEALGNLRRAFPTLGSQIPDLARIIAFRNVLIHGYASVDDRLVWDVVEGELPALLKTLGRMLREVES